jgi:hypothetical protein
LEINELYEDASFNNLLVGLANKKRILSFDDFRQDVFLEIVERGYTTMSEFKRAANRVAWYYYKYSGDVDIASLAYENENGELETDDEVMARLVHSGKGRYIS